MQKKMYPNLSRMAVALLSCFHGPAIEGSFNLLDKRMGSSTNTTSIETYSATQTVKYHLREHARANPPPAGAKNPVPGDQSIQYFCIENFKEVSPDPRLVANIKSAASTNRARQEKKRLEKEKRLQDLEVPKENPTSKRKANEEAMATAKKQRIARLEQIVKESYLKKQRRPPLKRGETVVRKKKSSKAVDKKKKSSKAVDQKKKSSKTVHQNEKSSKTVHQKEKSSKTVHQKEKSSKTVHQKEKSSKTVHHKEKSSKTVHHKEKSSKTAPEEDEEEEEEEEECT